MTGNRRGAGKLLPYTYTTTARRLTDGDVGAELVSALMERALS